MDFVRLSEGLWTLDRPLKRLGIDLRHRMTVIRGARGLIVHSPVECREDVAQRLDELGEVHAVIAPSLLHDLYFPSWFERYPRARFLCAPGFRAAHARLPFHGDLSAAAVADLDAGLDIVLIEGMPRVNECVFLHYPSRSLIVADLLFNLQAGQGVWGRTVLRLNRIDGRAGCSRLFRMFIRERGRFGESLSRVLAREFERVVVGHGTVIETDGRRILREAYDWL